MISILLAAIAYFGSPADRPEYAPAARRMSGIASLAVSPVNGRMWCTWYCGISTGEDTNNYVVLSTSIDRGKTWKEVLVADPDGKGPRRTFDPCLWVNPDGRLWWTWTDRDHRLYESHKDDGHVSDSDVLYLAELSAEDEPTGRETPREIARGVMMCKPTVLRDGAWALPVAAWNKDGSSRMIVTTDHGKAFSLRGAGTIPKDDRLYDEHMFVEKPNGDIDCYSRTKSGLRIGTSSDGGRTWGAFEKASFSHPSARLFVRRLKSGNLLMVRHDPPSFRPKERTDLTAFVSRDDGKTWEGGLLLDPRVWISYPDGQEMADGTIYVCYDYARYNSDQHFYFATFTEADALAGRNVSGRVTRQNLVSALHFNETSGKRELDADGRFKAATFRDVPFSVGTTNGVLSLRVPAGKGYATDVGIKDGGASDRASVTVAKAELIGAALDWAKERIYEYGGDPLKVNRAMPDAPGMEQWTFREELAKPVVYHAPKAYRVEDRFGLTNALETVREDLDRFMASASEPPKATLTICRGAVDGRESYRVDVKPDGSVVLTAEDEDGIRRGVYWIEDRIAAGDLTSTTRKPWLKHRISRCYFSPIKRPPANRDELMDDVDYYPDAYLNRLAHEGVNGIWLTAEWRELAATSFCPRDPSAERRLAKLHRTVEKCARYGIRVWLFGIEPKGALPDDPLRRERKDLFGEQTWYEQRAVWCPSSPDALRYVEESVRDIFTRVPGLGGVLLIANGERPTTCLSTIDPVAGGAAHCPRCAAVPAEELFERTAQAVVRGLRAAGSSADYMAWFYHPQPPEMRADWVGRIPSHAPEGTILAYNFESGALRDQLEHPRHGGDYWLSFVGPSDPFTRVAEAARAAQTPLAAKIQVGCSHECATLPYVPVPGLLYRKYRAMRETGVTSVLQCWYFGNYPGVMNKAAGELAFETFADDEASFLRRLAKPEWGEDAERMADIWRRLSDAYAHYPLSNQMQYYGPFHAGLAWPLLADVSLAPLAPNWKPSAWASGDLIGEALDNHALAEAAELARRMDAGAAALTDDLAALAGRWKDDRERTLDLNVIRTLQLHFASAADVLSFYRDRAEALEASRVRHDPAAALRALSRMKETVLREERLTAEMIPLAEADARLGFHSEAETHQYFPAKLRWRLDGLSDTTERIDSIAATIKDGREYPESDFERSRPSCTMDGEWTKGARNVSFSVRPTEAGDVAFAVRFPTNASVRVQLLDAAGAAWYRQIQVDATGARGVCVGDAVGANQLVSDVSTAQAPDGVEVRFVLSVAACGGELYRPAWIRLIDYDNGCAPIWPADRSNEPYRLNLGGVHPFLFGRLIVIKE